MKKIIIATTKTWNIEKAEQLKKRRKDEYSIKLMTSKEELTIENIAPFQPEWIFFPHWSWIIPPSIYEQFKCVIFHTSSLPYGRGGAPLQNQIIRGIYNSEVCAVRAEEALDAGPVYKRESISLAIGSVEEILISISEIVFRMIPEIVDNDIHPEAQEGDVTLFERRKRKESKIPTDLLNIRSIYDFIRMLDGEGYPPAYFELGNFRIEMTNARMKKDNSVEGRFIITRNSGADVRESYS